MELAGTGSVAFKVRWICEWNLFCSKMSGLLWVYMCACVSVLSFSQVHLISLVWRGIGWIGMCQIGSQDDWRLFWSVDDRQQSPLYDSTQAICLENAKIRLRPDRQPSCNENHQITMPVVSINACYFCQIRKDAELYSLCLCGLMGGLFWDWFVLLCPQCSGFCFSLNPFGAMQSRVGVWRWTGGPLLFWNSRSDVEWGLGCEWWTETAWTIAVGISTPIPPLS